MASEGSKVKKKESNYQNEIFRPLNLPFMYYGDLGVEKLPITGSGVLSLASYAWLTPIMCRLSGSRIMSVLGLQWWEEDTTGYNVNRLEESWEAEKAAKGIEKASLLQAVLRTYKNRIIASLIAVLITLTFSFVGSAGILRLLLEHVSDADSDTRKGSFIVAGLIACEMCRSLTFSLAWAINYWNGIRVRGAAMSLLYKKVLKLKCLGEKKIGEIVNLCSYDGQRFFEVMANGPFIIGGPVIFVAGSVYLFFLLGPWAAVGCVTYIFFILLLNFLAKGMAYYRTQATHLTGERVGLMTEVLSCIKLIKINVWEKAFTKRVTGKRREEQAALEKALFLQSITSSLSPMIPIFASILMFLCYILSGNQLTGAKAFTLISVMYSMSFALTLMIYGIRTLLDARISAQRYQEVLKLEEIEVKPPPKDDSCAIVFEGGSFSWDEEMDEEEEEDELLLSLTATELAELQARKPMRNGALPEERRRSTKSQATWHLADINLSLEKGKLIGICGMKGSGKSSLLSAILGRMQTMDGSVEVGGKMAYTSQEPWIFNGTARDNILFGKKYDKDHYQSVIEACGLTKDFETFSTGDRVEIGDRGLTLSGGQKQRVSIARAAYSQSDIYLLDDPLSAQDVMIGRHIFAQCFRKLLHGKTVIFVTHHLEYLSSCDYVVLMQHGRIVEQGTHTQLMDAQMEYAELLELYHSKYQEIQRERLKSHTQNQGDRMPQRGFSRHSKKLLTKQLSRMSTRDYQHQFSAMSTTSSVFTSDYDYVDIDDLVDAQELEECKVPAKVVHTYLMAAGGYCVILLALISFIISMAVQAGANWWLAYWLSVEAEMSGVIPSHAGADNSTDSIVNHSVSVGGSSDSSVTYAHNGSVPLVSLWNDSSHWTEKVELDRSSQTHMHALVYGLIAIAMVASMAIREVLFIKIILRAASRLHKGMLGKLLRCPMKFFDTTPLGIILNRFAADLDELDVRFPTNCGLFLQNIMMVTLALGVICYVFPWDLLAVLPLAIVFVVLAYKYAPILQRLKYIDSITRSPFLSHLAASVEGLATIHVFQQRDCFLSQFCEMVDQNMMPFFLFYAGNRWLALFLDLMTVTVMGITGFLVIFTLTTENAAQAGLALSFAIQITSLLQYTLRLSIETWSRFTSVHRIQDYIDNLPEEGSIAGERQEVGPNWPSHGYVTFHKYRMRYNDGLPFALKGISAHIQPQERIGVVGNSGSGKSSLGMALLRLVEAASGAILVDGLNIRDVKLETLRSKIAILAQDPVLFTGTIRYNLDPAGFCPSEEAMWTVLEKCHIKDKIEGLDDQLETMVEESGRNFSLGEKQLLCLARILLRQCKILILDEATASVDTRTESLVQKAVDENFNNCTIFIIAHRLNTIMNCDRVMVIEDGKIVELDSPAVLLQKSHSRFKTMWEALKVQPKEPVLDEDSVIHVQMDA